jgi:hypothetical protein
MAPRNAYPACLLAKNDRIGRARLDLLHRGDAIPLGLHALRSMRSALCAMRSAPYALRHAPCPMLVTPLGVRPFLKKISHKAPSTHNEGGAFLFCLGKPNSPIVIHSRKQRPCFQRRRVRTASRIKGLRYRVWNLTSPLMSWGSMHICL